MKSTLLRTGLLTCFILLGLSHENASAEMNWPAKCQSYGVVKPNINPAKEHINCLLTNAAIEAKIPPEVVKAVATKESDWQQFKGGQPYVSSDNGIGIMQITNPPSFLEQKLMDDIYFNIQTGVEILNGMFKRKDLPKINGVGPEIIENWYFPVLAYNGTKPVNSPLVQTNGSINSEAYQEKVFNLIQEDSFLDGSKLGRFPFTRADFKYDPKSDTNIVFNKLGYTLTDQMHTSTHLFHKGDQVVVTLEGATLRKLPSSSNTSTKLKKFAKNTTLIINGDFTFDQNKDCANKFVWFPVKTSDQKLTGYISSAYLVKRFAPPSVSTKVTNKAKTVKGKSIANASVCVVVAGKTYSKKADKAGNYNITIPVQNYGTKIIVKAKDNIGKWSQSRIITVVKVAPNQPTVNKVRSSSTTVTGKTEKYVTVTVKIGTKTYKAKANATGNYKVRITKQRAGKKLSVYAKDKKGI